jgi:muramoyltetrapeptide carboxypeptidase LdcA involved in peptidoglycan recycling
MLPLSIIAAARARHRITLLLAAALALGLGGSILHSVSHAKDASAATPIFPKAIVPGDTVMIVAPAKYLDKDRVDLAKKRLEKMGFKVRIPAGLFRRKGFLGGTDDERAAELMEAFADPKVNAIFPGTGGYGTTRIIDRLDYDVIRRNPKILVGFSDITGLHIAINQRTGLVTFHSPNPEWGLGIEKGLSRYAAKWFWRAILAKEYLSAARGGPGYTILPRVRDEEQTETEETDADASYDKYLAADGSLVVGSRESTTPMESRRAEPASDNQARVLKKQPTVRAAARIEVPRVYTVHGGKGRGRLIGGNLSVMHAMMGTPFEIQTAGKILFIEDVGEAPYRVDRMLQTLRAAGKFDHVAGIILGQFTPREEEATWDDDESVDEVLRGFFGKLEVPVLTHFPIGHVRYNTTLPVGAMAELDGDAQTVRILENPVKLP